MHPDQVAPPNRRQFVRRDFSELLSRAAEAVAASLAYEPLDVADRKYIRHRRTRAPLVRLRVRFPQAMSAQSVCNWWANSGLPYSTLLAIRRGAHTVVYMLVDQFVIPLDHRQALNPANKKPKGRGGGRPKDSRQRVSQTHARDRSWIGFRL